MIKRRLLRAILNSGVSAWKEFSYDEKRQAILEVTPYTYNVKYALATLSNVIINDTVKSIVVDLRGHFTDAGFAFEYNGKLCKYRIEEGKAMPEELSIEKSPILILSRGNTEEELESITSFGFEGVITPIVAIKFNSATPYISMSFISGNTQNTDLEENTEVNELVESEQQEPVETVQEPVEPVESVEPEPVQSEPVQPEPVIVEPVSSESTEPASVQESSGEQVTQENAQSETPNSFSMSIA